MLEVEFSFQARKHAVGTSKHAALLIGLNDQCSMLLIYVQMIDPSADEEEHSLGRS